MKTYYLLSAVTLSTFLFSCSKQDVSPQNQSVNSNETSSENSRLAYNSTTGQYTLTLQPADGVGQDAWVKYWAGHPAYANTNYDSVQLIKGLAWRINGSLLRAHSFIKFTELNKVPATAQIISATLYLYGPGPGYPYVKAHLPMGNTSYPGSKFNDNSCYLQRVTSQWDESSLTWNNQPSVTTQNQLSIPQSDEQWFYDISLNVTQLLKPMVADNSKNYGFLLRLQSETAQRAMGFCSSESTHPAKRPKLVIVYK